MPSHRVAHPIALSEWLAPDQVRAITLNDDVALIDYAKPIVNELRSNMVRVDSDFSVTPFRAKIADAEHERVHNHARHRRSR